ncbi:MAG: ASCH domain-containing protein [Hylemonella sp.]|uniref:ASCH domain-containing protein n=1 Tax=Hylemonella sp. TaxID=2066020 RepID=UPI00391B6BAC
MIQNYQLAALNAENSQLRAENSALREQLAEASLRTLTLRLKAVYFNQIKAGTKTEEYRRCTPYWARRLEGRTYDRIVLTLGYPKAGDTERRLVLPWRGFTIKTIQHPHFGDVRATVYAINLEGTP